MREKACVSKSLCPIHKPTYTYRIHMLQGKRASTHHVLPAAGVIDTGDHKLLQIAAVSAAAAAVRPYAVYIRLY